MKRLSRSDLQNTPGAWDDLAPFDLVEICDGRAGFFIVLAEARGSGEKRFRLSNVYGYRVFDESDLLGYLPTVPAGIYCVPESEFQEWARNATLTGQYPPTIQHFVIVSANGVLEYLGTEMPLPVD